MVICAYFGLVIVDLGVTSWRRIARPAPEGVAGLPAHSEDQVDAEGQVERRVQELVQACGLSTREGEILGYLARGYNSTYIAKALFILANTVRSHIYNLYRKLGVTSRAELLELVNR